MFEDVVQDVGAHVEGVVSAKVGELEERLSLLLTVCATEACVGDESDSLKVLLAGVETWFREEHAALADTINVQRAMTKSQTGLLETLGKVKATCERTGIHCWHMVRLGNIEWDVAAIADTVQVVEN